MTMSDLIMNVDTLIHYDIALKDALNDMSTVNVTTYSIFKVDVQEEWDQIKVIYKKVSGEVDSSTKKKAEQEINTTFTENY